MKECSFKLCINPVVKFTKTNLYFQINMSGNWTPGKVHSRCKYIKKINQKIKPTSKLCTFDFMYIRYRNTYLINNSFNEED